jgi:hypothetical protein
LWEGDDLGHQRVIERRETLSRYANKLQESGSLKEPTLSTPRKAHRCNPLKGAKSKIGAYVASRSRIPKGVEPMQKNTSLKMYSK